MPLQPQGRALVVRQLLERRVRSCSLTGKALTVRLVQTAAARASLLSGCVLQKAMGWATRELGLLETHLPVHGRRLIATWPSVLIHLAKRLPTSQPARQRHMGNGRGGSMWWDTSILDDVCPFCSRASSAVSCW